MQLELKSNTDATNLTELQKKQKTEHFRDAGEERDIARGGSG